jgi:phospholipase C
MKKNLLSTAAMFGIVAAVAWSGLVAADDFDNRGPDFGRPGFGQPGFGQPGNDGHQPSPQNALPTKTPIKHLVVIFNENRSFDHYFGTYPNALNVDGEPTFEPAKNTPKVINNLLSSEGLLTNNPNLNAANGTGASNPFRLDRTQANTADQGHGDSAEQKAYDAGKNDLFPLNTGKGTSGGAGAFGTTGQVMGFFDGNTVTAFWNYAQNFAMSDNSWGDQYGPSTPGALNMFAGNTNGIVPGLGTSSSELSNSDGSVTLIGDVDPTGDPCSSTTTVSSNAKNIGDLLNAASIPWGSFVGGFNLQTINNNGTTGCARSSVGQAVGTETDYVPHHIWFQYFKSTANLTHARPTSTKAIGFTKVPGTQTVDPANHAYDLDDFSTALGAGNFPAVSFIKMASFQDGHPGNSDPLDEQTGLVTLINMLQQQADWSSTAVIIAYDDSDGWYDHAFAATTHGSFSVDDFLNGTGNCGIPSGTPEPVGLSGQAVAGRCGPGTRQPFMVISPFAKKNYVSHVLITQASIPQFIEDNWLKGERLGGGSFDATTGSIMDMFDFDKHDGTKLILDPTFGTVDTKGKDMDKS